MKRLNKIIGYTCMIAAYVLLVYIFVGDLGWIPEHKQLFLGSTCILLFFTGADFFLKK